MSRGSVNGVMYGGPAQGSFLGSLIRCVSLLLHSKVQWASNNIINLKPDRDKVISAVSANPGAKSDLRKIKILLHPDKTKAYGDAVMKLGSDALALLNNPG